jgi:DNA-binding GntR family transcriptional regulator
VQDISLSNLKDLFETMLIMERAAVALAARRIKKDQIEDLQRINRDLRQAWLEKNFLKVTYLNSRFHRFIYKATDNSFLFSYLDNLQNQCQRLAYMCFSKEMSSYDMQSHAELSIKDHQVLIELLEQGNDVEAANMITEHVKLFQRRVHHFILPSLDILDAAISLQEVQS